MSDPGEIVEPGATSSDVSPRITAEAAAFWTALLSEGLFEEAASFLEWALDNLELDLEELVDA